MHECLLRGHFQEVCAAVKERLVVLFIWLTASERMASFLLEHCLHLCVPCLRGYNMLVRWFQLPFVWELYAEQFKTSYNLLQFENVIQIRWKGKNRDEIFSHIMLYHLVIFILKELLVKRNMILTVKSLKIGRQCFPTKFLITNKAILVPHYSECHKIWIWHICGDKKVERHEWTLTLHRGLSSFVQYLNKAYVLKHMLRMRLLVCRFPEGWYIKTINLLYIHKLQNRQQKGIVHL